MKDPRSQLLGELEASLEGVLAVLGGDGALGRGAALDAARVRTETIYLNLREAEVALGEKARPLPEDLQVRVQSVLRIDALIQSLVGAAKEGISGELAKITQVRSLLRQHRIQDRPIHAGRSCDVQG